jgi:glycosyltransferase involved in cell wall biosynthesis
MKVLITTDNIGGVWTFSMNLAKGLINNGVDVFIAVLGDPLTSSQKKEISFSSYYVMNCRQEWMSDPWMDIARAGKWLLKVRDQVQPDLVHLNSYSLGSLPWNIPVVITAHSCVLSWWKAVKGDEAPREWDQYRRNVTAGIRSADVISAPSNTMMNAIESLYKPEKKRVVIYNGCSDSFNYTEEKENIVFSMGRLWDEAKNLKLLIEAAPKIAHPVYIAGDTMGLELTSLPGNVHLLGRLSPEEVAKWMSRAAIYLLPVIYEPFGYTFLEAAYSGCAIVTGNIESMREIWEDNVVYADNGNSDELAYTVNMLMWDTHRRRLLARNARKHAISNYTSDKMTSEYIFLYQSITESYVENNLKSEVQ